jgi:hypothetical protein
MQIMWTSDLNVDQQAESHDVLVTTTYPAHSVADKACDGARKTRIPQPAISSLHVDRGRNARYTPHMLVHPSRTNFRSPGGHAYAAVTGSPFRLAPPPAPTLPTADRLPTHTQPAATGYGWHAPFGPSILARCKLRDQVVSVWSVNSRRFANGSRYVLTTHDLVGRARPFFRWHLPRAHALLLERINHLNYSFDKWRSWFEDSTTEELFKYYVENWHHDYWSIGWRKRKRE